MDASDASLDVLPNDIRLIALAYACDPAEVGLYFLECCGAGELRWVRAIATAFDLAALSAATPVDESLVTAIERKRLVPWAFLECFKGAPYWVLALAMACDTGAPALVEWIADYFASPAGDVPRAARAVTLIRAATSQYSGRARWVTERLGATAADMILDAADKQPGHAVLAAACAREKPSELQYLADRLELDWFVAGPGTVSPGFDRALWAACDLGNLDNAMWLCARYLRIRHTRDPSPGGTACPAGTARILRRLGLEERADVAEVLGARDELGRMAIYRLRVDSSLEAACRGGHLVLAALLVEVFARGGAGVPLGLVPVLAGRDDSLGAGLRRITRRPAYVYWRTVVDLIVDLVDRGPDDRGDRPDSQTIRPA